MLALADALVANQGKGVLRFRFHEVASRIARRFGPQTATAWIQAATRFQTSIDPIALRVALASGDLNQVNAAVRASGFANMMRALEDPLRRSAAATGTASAQILEESGFIMQFNASHPNVVLFARDQVATLVVGVTKDVEEAIRTVVALGAQEGLTIIQQAQAIREVVPLAPNMAQAPLRLRGEILRGDISAATSRRLSAVDKQMIRSRIMRGTVDVPFASKMQERYSRSLLNSRAISISRTEALRAANAGTQESWVQAVRQRVLPKDLRRFWVVTADSRLSEAHATIPDLNEDGRRLEEPFDTTEGPFMFPPTRPRCRCSIGLGF